MAQSKAEYMFLDEDPDAVFGEYPSSDTDSEHDNYEVKTRRANKGKRHSDYHNKSFLEDSTEIFLDTPTSETSFAASSSVPSTSSTPRFRSRNSSVRSIQTVDSCMPILDRDAIRFELRYPSQEHEDDSASESEGSHLFVKQDECIADNGEIVDEGLRLYMMFLRDEIVQSRLRAPEYLSDTGDPIPRNITQLRLLADQFSVSPQRQWVRIQAESVPLETLDFASFIELLVGLFQEGGVTWERIVVLFFFCADLSIRALKERLMRTFQSITEWTTTFICDNFSRWIAANGGWNHILQQSISQASRLAFFGFCCVGIIAFCIFIRNNNSKM